ncbi:DgyrCDS7636 [Dimorphilus gyrociliatus]|uniref:DgyrCDS7636 n=1 Tax=Dimorphilus gyrociliatus TaxID=2664684 RepID=A0A7I8VTV2_9ANNE|nr:DgyrCDS7636 [Dimorphilus gyrociliatus]
MEEQEIPLSNDEFKSLKTDPESLHSYVYKEIEIIMNNKSKYTGWVYTIDPESFTIVLVNFEDNSIELITSHSIQGIRIINNDSSVKKQELDDLVKKKFGSEKERKQSRNIEDVIKYFNQLRIPVERQGNILLVAGIVNVTSPFTENDCVSTNPMALANIQKFLSNFE